MTGKKKQGIEFRYYEIPHGEHLLALTGDNPNQEYAAESPLPKLYFHNLLEVGYCSWGEGIIAFETAEAPYKAGTLAIIPPNCPHFIHDSCPSGSRWEYLYISPQELLRGFYPDNPLFIKKITEQLKKEQCFFCGGHNKLFALVRMILDECPVSGGYSGEYLRGLLLAFLISAAGCQTDGGACQPEHYTQNGGIRHITAALEYISKNYMDNIRMETLAETCNLSETHFRRLFAEYMNMAPLAYINLVRIKQACELIRNTGCSMEDAAARVGYTAVSSFNRNFRKIMGISPYQYKKSGENHQSIS